MQAQLKKAYSFETQPTYLGQFQNQLNDLMKLAVAGYWTMRRNGSYGQTCENLVQALNNDGDHDMGYTSEGGGSASHNGPGGVTSWLIALSQNIQYRGGYPPFSAPDNNMDGSWTSHADFLANWKTYNTDYNNNMKGILDKIPGGLSMKLTIINYVAQDPSNKASSYPDLWNLWTNIVGLDPNSIQGQLETMVNWGNSISSQLNTSTQALFDQINMAANGGFTLMNNERQLLEAFTKKLQGL
jgi:hypothetical protein